jgi:hypothetical protein
VILAASPPPAHPQLTRFDLQIAVDAPVRVHRLEGAIWLSDGVSIAVEHGAGFVQDGVLSADSQCSPSGRFAGFAGTIGPSAGGALGQRGASARARLLRWTGTRWQVEDPLIGERALLAPWEHGSALVAVWGSRAQGYSLRVLGASSASMPSPAPGAGCRTSLVEPNGRGGGGVTDGVPGGLSNAPSYG